MGFYQQSVAILRPAKVTSRYGGGEQLTYDVDEGAERIPVPFGVEVQPRTEVELADDTRIATQTGWTLITPDGYDLDVTEIDRITYAGRDLEIQGEVHRWPSDDYPSGVDHVSLTLEYRNG